GDGASTGMHKITGDIAQMAAQVPALFEALSGMQMSDVLGKIRTIGDRTTSSNDHVAADENGTPDGNKKN
ncbi:MAG TPA: hypothetical protein VKV03_15330, partial [Candidatus Binataceae bacterium]|nr:hypothetical protein [Candidatus Binataceae bacterium]